MKSAIEYSVMRRQCSHLDQIKVTGTGKTACDECVNSGDRWRHLRLCLTCGHVGCCDSSKNSHASKHFEATGHPLVRSIEPGECWMWCYEDERGAGNLDVQQTG
jgi:uncharacterized UBP type Zn finger protein